MPTPALTPQKSLPERVLHALLFELVALVLFAPLIALLTSQSLARTGALTVMLSLIAMFWNMLFSAGFEALERRLGWRRTLWVRLLHAGLFELGLLLVMVPLIAWWLQVGLLQALLLDIGLVLLFLPYTLIFNWLYDLARPRVLARRRRASTSA
ncbi:multidrug/biocide efflux PACE transporter [Halopseudomonas sabulinigri]|uniref:Chlorhexidine efflux transporter domain-containing protein n=1 Tax=Halopseudomonas sabulinigri TaxID=472181 RepID=A0ABP9ZKI6_9GAMM